MKILIADDSLLIRESIKDLLSESGRIEISEAVNGFETLQVLEKGIPDLVILDIGMPGMNGLDTLKKIRETYSKVKVCMLTNYPHKQYREKCFELGADCFINKNQDLQTLKNLVKQLQLKPGGKNTLLTL